MNYKYTIILSILMVFGLSKINGQLNLPDTSVAGLYDSLPAHLFPSQVLHNRSPLYQFSLDSTYSASPYNYPGIIPASVIRGSDFQYLYLDMSLSSMNPLLIPSPDELISRDSAARLLYDAPIMAMCLDFQQIHPFAVDSGWLYFDTINSVVTMMPDTIWIDSARTEYHASNPDSLAQLAISDHEVFASIIRNGNFMSTSSTVSVTFGLPSSLFISNKMPMPNQVSMDFADGNGFQNWAFDQARTIHYNFPQGVDDNQRILRLRLHFGNHVIESRMRIRVTPNIREADDVFFSKNLPYTCQVPRNGYTDAQTKVSIRYGNPQKELRKPVVLVEGFETTLDDYGDLTFVALQNGIIDNEYLEHLNDMQFVFDTLVSLGYDVVYVDLENSRRHVQRHSLAVVKILQHLNQELQNNGSDEHLVVIGASMGGLIVRHALKTMENADCCHNTRIYGTFDTPHQGAHIPLGIQHMAKAEHQLLVGLFSAISVTPVISVYGLYKLFNMESNWNDVLNSPAAYQMLVDHINHDASVLRQSFIQEMEALGHPEHARRIAIISGSEEGLAHQLTGEKAFVDFGVGRDLPYTHRVGSDWNRISFNNNGGNQQGFDFLKFRAFSESRNDRKVYEAAMNPLMVPLRLFAVNLIYLYHGVSIAFQNILFPFSQFPIVGGIADGVIRLIQRGTNVILPLLHAMGYTPFVYYADVGTPHYSESPGGLNNTPKSIADKAPMLTAPNEMHTFVPSVSALDITLDSLMMDISTGDVINDMITPFQSYWAPGRGDGVPDENQLHCAVTQPMYHWLMEQIDQEPAIRDVATGSLSPQLDRFFNYGRPHDVNAPHANILKSVEVVNGGQLFINHSNDVGFNPSGITGTSNSHYQVKTANSCDTNRVKISYGGLLNVGLAFANNTGELIFEAGSVLEIDSGGKLVVEDNSTLIIKQGAALEIHPNARIFLNGENAKLVIQGKVIMHANAELTYSTEVSELGVLVFDQPHWNDNGPVPAGTNWSIGNNARFVLQGNAQHAPTVVCKHPLNAYDENRRRFSLIEFDEINLFIDSGMYANLTADSLVFVNSNITSLNNGSKHMGIQIWGKSLNDVLMKNNDFSDCYRCFKGYQLGVQQALLIDSCRFSNSDIALEFENGNFTLNDVYVNDCQMGVVSNRALGQSRILYSDFEDVNAPVRIESETSAGLMVSSSTFEVSGNNPLDTAIYHHSVGLRMTCSSIDNFSVGIDCRSAVIDMSDEAMNQINATLPIMLTDATGVLLANGENIFSVTPVYVSGSLHNSAVVPIINQKIDASNNAMPHNASGIGVVQYNGLLYDLHVQTNYFTTMCTNNTNGFALPTVDGWIGNRNSGITVNVNGQGVPFEFALDGSFALLYGEEESHIEEYAMDVLDDVIMVLDQAIPQLSETSSLDAYQIAKVGFTMAYDLLRIAYMYNHLEVVHADPLAQPNTYITSMNNYISVFSGLLPNGSQYDNHRADLELSRAHLYRMGHYHSLALNALNEVMGNLSQRNIDRRDYWQCVMGWEQQMLLGNISEDEFMEEFWNCNTLYSPYINYESDDADETSKDGFFAANDIVFYPNPTNDFLYMRTDGIAKLDDELLFTVTSLEGRTVMSEVQTASYVQRVNVNPLSSGVYIISVKTPYREYQQRFVKQ